MDENWNEGAMFPETIPLISCVRDTGKRVRCEAQVKSAEGRLKPLEEKVRQLICRMAEKLTMVRMIQRI
ncbi:hypothetical protein [Paenibacillus sp.]|jgi:hypothetical protein|uniref:hypothetical protein n=1 Tax=Paenibacillus sp. TaxID=58172 RepID=UPI00281B7AB2|nr:hypothetical protein [Paenibacillus sp.]MDR0271419.1 hypothetical protein [Paenibacillus sp.]